MKLYEITHITERHNPNEIMGAELRFTHVICPMKGDKMKPIRQPDDWDHVRRLTNNLFYAWDDDKPVEGSVYLGAFERHRGATKPVDVNEIYADAERADASTGQPFHTLNEGERLKAGDEWRFESSHPWTRIPDKVVGTFALNRMLPGNPTYRRYTGPKTEEK